MVNKSVEDHQETAMDVDENSTMQQALMNELRMKVQCDDVEGYLETYNQLNGQLPAGEVQSLLGDLCMSACELGHTSILAVTRQHCGINLPTVVDSITNHGLIHAAAAQNNGDTIRWLAGVGVNVDHADAAGRVALHAAAENGNLEAVAILAQDFNADIFIKDNWNISPVALAQECGHLHVVNWLRDWRIQNTTAPTRM